MAAVDMVCAEFFLKNQGRLFDKPVAKNAGEALEFLEDCMAQVFDSRKELVMYMKEEGVDAGEGGAPEEALEVFALPDGRYLYVEG